MITEDITTSTILTAFGLTLFAGMATGIGSLLAFFTHKTNHKFLAGALGFSAGVMIYVSMVEILVKAKDCLVEEYGATKGNWLTVAAFFFGIFFIGAIDRLVPSYENPHEVHGVEELTEEERKSHHFHRMGMFSALAIAIHNFPEGLATFTSALTDPTLGVSIAIAIAIHNIPEGIAVSIPIYYATGSRKRALWLSALSGASEPLGAIIGYLFFMHYFNQLMFGVLFAFVAGIMVFISLDELLPTAEKYGDHHICIYGLVAGMGVMAISLLLFV